MANNFKPWVDTPTAGQQVQSASVFATDAQRVAGFNAGDPASALRVNSALRQANIVIAGLMQFCDEVKTLPNGLSLLSTVTQVKNAIKDSVDALHNTTLTSAKDYTDTEIETLEIEITDLDNSLSTVAKTGSYTDLLGKPDISLLAAKESPTFTGAITIPDAEEETAPVSLQQLNSSIDVINSILDGVALSINNLAERVAILEENLTHGTVEVVEGNSVNSVSGGVVNQPFGTTVSLSCTLKPQQPPFDTKYYTSFDGWYKDGAKVSNQMNYTFSLSMSTAGIYTATAQRKAKPPEV